MIRAAFFTSTLIASLLSGVAPALASGVALPQVIKCTTSNLSAGKVFQSFSLTVSKTRRTAGELDVSWITRNGEVDSGVFVVERDRGLGIYDFGVRAKGGDQYSYFEFKVTDLANLKLKAVNQVSGKYFEGYDWIDGDHVREMLTVTCTL
jgi:hypothetical protein